MKLAASLATAALLAASPALAADPVVLKMSSGTPSASKTWTDQIYVWVQKVEKESGGTLKIETYPDGKLSKNGETANAVLNGIADIGWDLPQASGARFQSILVTNLPGTYRDPEIAAEAYYHGWKKGVMGQALKEYKIIWLQPVPNAAYYLKDKLKSTSNFDGLKVAMGSKQRAQLTEAMNGVPVAIGTAEYYTALQKGVAEGVMSTVGAVAAWKVDELTNYYLYGAFGGGTVMIVMNKAKYEALPPAAKKAIDDNSGVETWKWASKWLYDYENGYMENTMLKRAGTEQHWLTDAEEEKWKPAFKTVTAAWIKGTPDGQAIYDTFVEEVGKARKMAKK